MIKINRQQVLRGIIYSVSCVAYLSLHSSGSPRFAVILLSTLCCLALLCLTSEAPKKQAWSVWTAVVIAAAFLFLRLHATKENAGRAFLYTLASAPFFYGVLQCCSQRFTNEIKWNAFFNSFSFFLLGVGFTLIGIVELIVFSFSSDIWLDEAYSLALISHPWQRMLNLAAQDVHPPLYYIILKALTEAMQEVLPSLPVISIAKLVSCVPYVILLAFAAFKVRRIWGNYVAGLFALSLVAAPSLISQGVEIRMYGWAMLFVTLTYFFAYDVMHTGRVRDWACFTIAGLASAYTHYYACIAVMPIYLFLLYFFSRRGRKELLYWALSASITVVGYLPWLFIFLSQVGNVCSSYWILLPKEREYSSYAFHLFLVPLVAGVAALIVSLICCKLKHRTMREQSLFILSGVACAFFAFAIGLTVSYLIKPVFIFRYLYPAIPCLWLSLILGCNQEGKAPLRAVLTILLVGCLFYQLLSFMMTEGRLTKEHHKLMQVLTAHPDAVLVCDAHSDQLVFSRLTERNCLCFDTEENTDFFKKVFGIVDIPNISDFEGFLMRKQHPAYVVLISDNKSRACYKELLSQYYVGSYKELLLTDMYVIPTTENGTQP